ncbi:MAG TPA: membrane protein insertase YidC [Acidimicrobiales bacterium]
MFDLIATVLAFFYGLVHSYGLAIVLLTLLVMAVTSPFTYRGTKSMIQLQRLQPQIKAIQTKYRDDREKMNQEMLAFYRANNLNPVGGCLPMIIQIPIFLVLYRVVSGLTARLTDVGLQAGLAAAQLQIGVPLTPGGDNGNRFNPAYISHDSDLWQDLSRTDEMKSWGIDLSESASKALSTSFTHALPFLALIAIVLVTGIIQQRQIQGRQRRTGAPTAINSQQQMIMKIMPFFLPIFSFGVPAALVVYFIVSNVWRIGLQAFITRTLYANVEPAAPIDTTVVEETPADKPGTARSGSKEPSAKQASGAKAGSEAPARSAMGRNRRLEQAGSGATRAARAKKSRPAPSKSKPERAPTTSGRVTPPGARSRGRKKKRT